MRPVLIGVRGDFSDADLSSLEADGFVYDPEESDPAKGLRFFRVTVAADSDAARLLERALDSRFIDYEPTFLMPRSG